MRLCCGLALLLTFFAAKSHAQVSAPRVGLVRYGNGAVYPVLGVAGNYLIGKRLYDAVDALSFSGAGGILVRGGTVLLIDSNLTAVAQYDRGATDAVVEIGEGLNSAAAWIPTTKTLVHWDGKQLVPLPLSEVTTPTAVFSVRKNDDETATLLERTATGEIEEDHFSLKSGSLLSQSLVPGLADDATLRSAYPQGSSFLTAGKGQVLVVSPTTGLRKSLPIRAEDLSFERVSGTVVHLHSPSSGRDWLVQFTGDQPCLFELPAAPVEKVTQ